MLILRKIVIKSINYMINIVVVHGWQSQLLYRLIGATAMLFTDNKYTSIYYSIILRAQSRVLNNGVYFEKHHIIPKSLGGNNRKENLVKLTAREHFIVHWLLPKMVVNKQHKWKMLNAFHCMCYRNNDINKRYRITNRIFETIKHELSIARREQYKGENNPMFGKKHSTASKEKMSIKNKGRSHPQTEEAKAKISKANKGVIRDAEYRAKVSKVHKGKIETEETKLKKSLSHLGNKHSAETLLKLSLNSGRAKPVVINGIEYRSIKLAALTLFPDLSFGKAVTLIKNLAEL